MRIYYKFNRQERLELITNCISGDSFYREVAGYSFEQMINITNNVIESFAPYSFHNPLNFQTEYRAYFKPMRAHKRRVGLIRSEIHYAAHLITTQAGKQRCCDTEKIRNIKHILTSIAGADDIVFDNFSVNSTCYIGKRISQNNNIVIVGRPNPLHPNYIRVVTYLPNQSDRQYLKKITPIQV